MRYADALFGVKKLTSHINRRHVFADLKPYICTFSNCRDELLTFSTRKLWEDHEFGQHRIKKYWTCHECPEKLLSPESWESHLEDRHGRILSKNQRSILLPVVEIAKEQDIKIQAYPLCLEKYCWATVVSQVFLVCIWLIVCVSLGLAYVCYSKVNVNAAKALC